MKKHDDFLIEILTEELPPKALNVLAAAFYTILGERLEKSGLSFNEMQYFAAPRRLAVLVKALASHQADQRIERKGPALKAAFDAKGQPSKACIGFANSLGVTPADLKTITNEQGEWVGLLQHVSGKSVDVLMPEIVEQVVNALPIPKRMRWGNDDTQFVRPVHAVMMMYGKNVIHTTLLGCKADNKTRGHRFHAPDWITLPEASAYAGTLAKYAHVIADFAGRREIIRDGAQRAADEKTKGKGRILISSDAFLDEVTGLVEWPVALCGSFEAKYLELPKEVLISSMEDHQRYFPVIDANDQLLPYFVTISNIESADVLRVIHGNERVIRARLADAAFFYQTDKTVSLASRVDKLNHIIFQAKLGTIRDKMERVTRLALAIANCTHAAVDKTKQAAQLAKADLTTQMVGEFPELQGVMGYYYALHDGEDETVAIAIKEHYLPRFAGDALPTTPEGQALAIADRIDTLIGTFGVNQIPTGDKDPYGLRRAALGVLRILIEKEIHLDLKALLVTAQTAYGNLITNKEAASHVLSFMQERLRAWYLEQGVTPDIFAAVAAIEIRDPLDAHQRLLAVQSFKQLSAAEALSSANKRVSNILAKYTESIAAQSVDPKQFENDAEKNLARELEAKAGIVTNLSQVQKYDEVLLQLSELRKPIDDFFDTVMVMTEDRAKRENRILLLRQLRHLFLQVADIALLQ